MIEILEEPVGNTYRQLISLAFNICDEFILVKRDQIELSKNSELLIEELNPYVKAMKKQEEWPEHDCLDIMRMSIILIAYQNWNNY